MGLNPACIQKEINLSKEYFYAVSSMDSVITVTRIAQSSTWALSCGIQVWLLTYPAMEEGCHFQIELKFKIFCGNGLRFLLTLPAIHLFYEFLSENLCVTWGDRLNKGILLTLEPMKLLR